MALSSASGRCISFLLLPRRRFSTSAVPRAILDVDFRRLAHLRRFSDIESLLEPLKKDPENAASEPAFASIVASYASAGMLEHAIRTLEELPTLGSPRTVLSLNALLNAISRSHRRLNQRQLVPELFADLTRKFSITPDAYSYSILVKHHCLAREHKKAFSVIKQMEEKNIEVTAVIYTTIIDSFYKEGKPEQAEKVWKEMGIKGIEPDLPAYNVRVMYKALHGKPKDVFALIRGMEAAGLKPDIITYNYLMACYCKNGRFGDAKKVYKGLEEKGCAPNGATFMNLVPALCKNGDIVGGLEVFKDSMKHNKVDFGSVKLLVERLVKASDLSAAKWVVDELKKKFPEYFVREWKKLEELVDANVNGERERDDKLTTI